MSQEIDLAVLGTDGAVGGPSGTPLSASAVDGIVPAYQTATAYVSGQQVSFGAQIYYAQTSFTSGASFAADGAKWGQLSPLGVTASSLQSNNLGATPSYTVAANGWQQVVGVLNVNCALTATIAAGGMLWLVLDNSANVTLSINGTPLVIPPTSGVGILVTSVDGSQINVTVLGAPGPQGATGAGTRGSIWTVGAGNPGTIVGQLNGDLYLDISGTVGNVWQLQAGTWVNVGNIRGAVGTGIVQTVPLGFVAGVALTTSMVALSNTRFDLVLADWDLGSGAQVRAVANFGTITGTQLQAADVLKLGIFNADGAALLTSGTASVPASPTANTMVRVVTPWLNVPTATRGCYLQASNTTGARGQVQNSFLEIQY